MAKKEAAKARRAKFANLQSERKRQAREANLQSMNTDLKKRNYHSHSDVQRINNESKQQSAMCNQLKSGPIISFTNGN